MTITTVLSVVVLFSISASALQDEWLQFGNDGHHSYRKETSDIRNGTFRVWTNNDVINWPSDYSMTVGVEPGIVIGLYKGGGAVAIDSESGETLWIYICNSALGFAINHQNGTVYLSCRWFDMYGILTLYIAKLDLQTGKELARLPVDLMIKPETLMFLSYDSRFIYATIPNSSPFNFVLTYNWDGVYRTARPGIGMLPPVSDGMVFGGTFNLTDEATYLAYGYQNDDKFLWYATLPSPASFVADDLNNVYYTLADNKGAHVHALDKQSGKLAWSFSTNFENAQVSPPSIDSFEKSSVLVFTCNSKKQGVYAIDTNTGELAWAISFRLYTVSTPMAPIIVGSSSVIVPGVIDLTSGDLVTLVLSLHDGSLLYALPGTSSPPIVVNNCIYISVGTVKPLIGGLSKYCVSQSHTIVRKL